MARLLLGVSGGIAAYKALETVRLAVKAGHAVRVVQTEASTRFVGAASFAGLTGAPVLSDAFEPDPMRGAYPGEPSPPRSPISHLALVQRADVYLIAPASANTIAKLAHGHADDLLTTAALAAPCPVVLAPAMNNRMYRHPATQANLELLTSRGVTVIAPGEGELASHGEHGIGRLAEPAELLAACESLLGCAAPDGARGRWLGRRVLVTAGGTREPIDSVRFIGNRSSGRMGFALAAQAARRGAEVTLVAANVALEPPPAVSVVEVQTAAELGRACEREFAACDVLLMTAAVSDFRPSQPAASKLKKDRGVPRIELEPTEDVLSALAARRRRGQVLVGFAAEHGEGAIGYGRAKLERKRLDAVVVNDVGQPGIGFDAHENEVTILLAGGHERRVARTSKERVAAAVLDEVELLLDVEGVRAVEDEKESDDRNRPARV
ncbi:MAG: bifunctional phosphopantothenoylcysteine decarboxylase/phosphopantothenate--cysteine ligase CoaBC [Solirubrobacteraceae bacterium]